MFSVHVIPVRCQNTYNESNGAKMTPKCHYIFALCLLKALKKQVVGISSHAPKGDVPTREMMIMKSLRNASFKWIH